MLVTIFLLFALVFGSLSIFTIKIKRSIIYMGIFSLFMSFICLLYQAPDVAISEAAIGCSLSTILFLIAVKKNEITKAFRPKDIIHGLLKFFLALVGCGLMLGLYLSTDEVVGTTLKDFYTSNIHNEHGANNAVAAIYLNYRIFDSIFETLMLMLSVMGVIYLSWRKQHEN